MSGKKKDIWDVMFSLEKKHLPLSRNYLQQLRGSLNPINTQVMMKPNKEYLGFCEKLNPVELYALDLELNLTFRKLADFILFGDKNDIYEDSPVWENLFEENQELEKLIWDTSNTDLSVHDMVIYAYELADAHLNCDEDPLENIHESMREMAEFQFTIEYYIENSSWDYKIKAEAFLRSHYLSNFIYADDETLIYLQNTCAYESDSYDFPMLDDPDFSFYHFDIDNSIHKKVATAASAKWDHYKNAWQSMSYSQENPFEEKYNISGLRHFNIHNLHFLNELIYNTESRHLFSQQDISSFCKMLNIFRTGLESKYIQKIISSAFKTIVTGISNQKFIFGYNYTSKDRSFLLSLMHQFLGGRFGKIAYDDKFLWSRDNLVFDPWSLNSNERNWSTLDFDDKKESFLPLICFNMFAVWFGKPDNYRQHLSKTSEKIMNEQKNYGFWADSNFNPEFMTVLALDAFNVENSLYQSFPSTKIDLVEDSSNEQEKNDKTNIDLNENFKKLLDILNSRMPRSKESKKKTKKKKTSKSSKVEKHKEIEDACFIIHRDGKIVFEYKGPPEPIKFKKNSHSKNLILFFANRASAKSDKIKEFLNSKIDTNCTIRDVNKSLNKKIQSLKIPGFPKTAKFFEYNHKIKDYCPLIQIKTIDQYERDEFESSHCDVYDHYEDKKKTDK